MPEPRRGEKRKDFMDRCIPEVVREGKEQDEAVAQCSSIFERSRNMDVQAPYVELRKTNSVLNIDIFDVIGGELNSSKVSEQLKGNPKNIKLRINSPGGDVFEAIAIFNLLKDTKAKIEVDVISLAASAASFIAMAGDTVRISKNARMMIHNPFAGGIGDADELRKIADNLDELEDTIAEAYSARSGIDKDKIKKMMEEETWMSAETAVKQGFADEIIDAKNAYPAVYFNLSQFDFKNVPEDFAKSNNKLKDEKMEELLKIAGAETPEEAFEFFKNALDEKKQLQESLEQTQKELNKLKETVEQLQKPSDKEETPQMKALGSQVQMLSAKVENLDTELKAANKQLETAKKEKDFLAERVKEQTDYRNRARLEERKAELSKLNGKYISPAQFEKAVEAYVKIELDQVDETQKGFELALNMFKAGGPVYEGMSDVNGTGAEGVSRTYDSAMAEVAAKAAELVEQEKAKNLTEAQEKIFASDEKLKQRYNQELYPA